MGHDKLERAAAVQREDNNEWLTAFYLAQMRRESTAPGVHGEAGGRSVKTWKATSPPPCSAKTSKR